MAAQGTVRAVTAAGEYRLRTGEAVFLAAGCVHEVVGEGPGAVLRSAVFHPRFISGMDTLIWQKYLQPLQNVGAVGLLPKEPWQAECIGHFNACWGALEKEPPGFEIQAREALSKLAFLLCTQLDARQRQPSAR